MSWKQIAEEQIERIAGFSAESQAELLRNSLIAFAGQIDRMYEDAIKRVSAIAESIPDSDVNASKAVSE